jgi:hypothetical protein
MVMSTPRVVASNVNETYMINLGTAFANKSMVWLIQMNSPSDNLSPMIDSSRISALLVSNRIDFRIDSTHPPVSPIAAAIPYVNELQPKGATSANARYITNPVSLATSSNSIHTLLAVMLPYGSQVDVYYKILPINTNDTFDNQAYVLMTPDPDTDFSPAQNIGDFKDFYWKSDFIGEFTTFAIKIVLRSTNSSTVPLCKSLRVIALES